MIARRPAWVVLGLASLAFVVLAAVLVPWGWGPVQHVGAEEIFTPAEIARAEDYSGVARLLGWGSYAVSLATALLLGLTQLGARLVGWFPSRLRLPLGVLALLVVGHLVTLPFGLVVRQRRLDYGLTRQGLGGYLRDEVTGLLVGWVATTIGLALLVWLARRTPRWWFAWAGVGAAGLAFVLSFAYPLVVEPLFNRFTPMADSPLRQSILQLAAEERVEVDDVLVADASRRTTTLNAYVSGLGGSRRVVVYDNLVTELPEDQVLDVVAHELAHAKNHDVLAGTTLGAVGSVAGLALLALLLDSRALRRRAGADGPGDPRIAALVLALAALGTFVANPVQNTASRAVEARADRDSLAATSDLDGFTQLQRNLALTSLADPHPPAWSQFWFGSHPTTLQRIGQARDVLG